MPQPSPPPPPPPPPRQPDNLNAQRQILSVREKGTWDDLELHVLQAACQGRDSELRRLLGLRPVQFNQTQESLLLHWAEWKGRWDTLLTLLNLGYRFTPHLMEAAVQRALRLDRLDFVRGIVPFLPDVHLPCALQLEALAALSESDPYLKDAARLLRVLPLCVDVELLRHVRRKLSDKLRGENESQAATKGFRRKLKFLRLIDRVVEKLSSETVTG